LFLRLVAHSLAAPAAAAAAAAAASPILCWPPYANHNGITYHQPEVCPPSSLSLALSRGQLFVCRQR